MRNIGSGRLRHKATAQVQSDDQDTFGSVIESYTDVFSFRCNVQVLSGAELLKSGLSLNEENLSIMARYDSRLKYDHYLNWRNNRYSVKSIRPSDDLRTMVVTAMREIT